MEGLRMLKKHLHRKALGPESVPVLFPDNWPSFIGKSCRSAAGETCPPGLLGPNLTEEWTNFSCHWQEQHCAQLVKRASLTMNGTMGYLSLKELRCTEGICWKVAMPSEWLVSWIHLKKLVDEWMIYTTFRTPHSPQDRPCSWGWQYAWSLHAGPGTNGTWGLSVPASWFFEGWSPYIDQK